MILGAGWLAATPEVTFDVYDDVVVPRVSAGTAHDAMQTERPATRRPRAAGGVRDLTQRGLSPHLRSPGRWTVSPGRRVGAGVEG